MDLLCLIPYWDIPIKNQFLLTCPLKKYYPDATWTSVRQLQLRRRRFKRESWLLISLKSLFKREIESGWDIKRRIRHMEDLWIRGRGRHYHWFLTIWLATVLTDFLSVSRMYMSSIILHDQSQSTGVDQNHFIGGINCMSPLKAFASFSFRTIFVH